MLLSLFPGIGLLDRAFEEEGFCVVRGPDVLWGGDVRRFHPPAGKFAGVIGGPPCPMFSQLRHLLRVTRPDWQPVNLIPEFERIVYETAPLWFLMENVIDAPVPRVEGYGVSDSLLRDVWVGGVTNRLRRFSFGRENGCAFGLQLPIECVALHPEPEVSALAAGGMRDRPVRVGGSGKRKDRGAMNLRGYQNARTFADHCRKQGLPADFLSDAPFTIAGKVRVVGNGVPIPMGRAVAKAVKAAVGYVLSAETEAIA